MGDSTEGPTPPSKLIKSVAFAPNRRTSLFQVSQTYSNVTPKNHLSLYSLPLQEYKKKKKTSLVDYHYYSILDRILCVSISLIFQNFIIIAIIIIILSLIESLDTYTYIHIYISCEFLPNSSQKVSGAREKRKKEREGGSDLERGAIGRGPGRKCTRGRDCARRM